MYRSVYLAGPDVFYPNARALGDAKTSLCEAFGLKGRFPLDKELDLTGLTPFQAGLAIYRGNLKLMDQCDIVIANLTPFRGPGMDGGTAFELGYMQAQFKQLWGYSLDARSYQQRVVQPTAGVDENGLSVERFTMADNLMMIGAIEDSGGQFIARDGDCLSIDDHLQVLREVLQALTGQV
ncbi:hypothetical protein WH50_18225 [Pokkaliibacter plantistimulans]|uniref:Nucleoside 2-deoxyribosyltransferase n=1 Tax=Pokkaliibacter plantistimulans TaxID=1635171 RepID=A0ABX5LTB9_9GAMM|nr:nucleoside 2-deoxyribosyltransferase [Pokkaliibacter plantistimulans]PXF29892.1 hypothetical protein WH50_18225 [Pokkaliibacter plantistimulans]